MEFIEDIFIGGSINELGTIIYSLKKNVPVLNIYCLCIKTEGKNLLEIMTSWELLKNKNENKKYIVIGIANGKMEAYDLAGYIFQFAEDNDWELNNFKSLVVKER